MPSGPFDRVATDRVLGPSFHNPVAREQRTRIRIQLQPSDGWKAVAVVAYSVGPSRETRRMTTATPRPVNSRLPATDRQPATDDSGGARTTAGWYDPDGAAWEPESADGFESFRATTRPRIHVVGSDKRRR